MKVKTQKITTIKLCARQKVLQKKNKKKKILQE